MLHYLNTGLRRCYDALGAETDCAGTGQDAETSPGLDWPEPRFETNGDTVLDRATGLYWTRDANPAEFPLGWEEALEYTDRMNAENRFGRGDWRLPNRRELRSLIDYQRRKPALPPDHPFIRTVNAWYWSSTTAAVNTAYAWYVHLEGGRMFYGHKEKYYLVWPVAGKSDVLPDTGQVSGYDASGNIVEPASKNQDGAVKTGRAWPAPRFEAMGEIVLDRLTGLYWTRKTDMADGPADWRGALECAAGLNLTAFGGRRGWRLPTINELESLVDASRHSPALPSGHPFTDLRITYASSTTSGFETDWCMVLHLQKGAVGVAHKSGGDLYAWAVSSPEQ